jgi:hypothetical protein
LRNVSADAISEIEKFAPRASESAQLESFDREWSHLNEALFLHEWAHTRGAIHSEETCSIMARYYSRCLDHFDEPNRRIVAATYWRGSADRCRRSQCLSSALSHTAATHRVGTKTKLHQNDGR